MNAKVEKIEQIIQIINRNLQLVFSGQPEGATPLDLRSLQRFDTNKIFGGDKFGYEMVHFLKMNSKPSTANTISATWDRNFFKGLENLLVECAVVKDEIEKDCFVCRVYSWFTEKLVERRDLPRGAIAKDDLDELKKSVSALGGTHAVKALDNFMKTMTEEENDKIKKQRSEEEEDDEMDTSAHDIDVQELGDTKRLQPNKSLYTKHTYPGILTNLQQNITFGTTLSPKKGIGNTQYGMIYNVPESDAEKGMHELFIAKRMQEAFEWKAQQQLALVLDRRDAHLSRLESDALRRTETSSTFGKASTLTVLPAVIASPNRKYAPDMSRPFSAKRRSAAIALKHWEEEEGLHTGDGERDASDILERFDGENVHGGQRNISLMVTSGKQNFAETIPKAGRTAVLKTGRESIASQSASSSGVAPMRFRNDLPEAIRANLERQKNYGQQLRPTSEGASEFGSDDLTARTAHTSLSSRGPEAVVLTVPAAPATRRVIVKKSNASKELRKASAASTGLRDMAVHDSEAQVFCEQLDARRMPATIEMERWLEDRERQRAIRVEAYHAALLERSKTAVKSKIGSKGAKEKGGDKKKDGKSSDKISKKLSSTSPETTTKKSSARHYKSADHFMTVHFPSFDSKDNPDSLGPVRTAQIEECRELFEVLNEAEIKVSEKILRKALVIPQDRPEVICLENLREASEGLMINPLPKECWRSCKIEGTDTKKKKKGKKTKN